MSIWPTLVRRDVESRTINVLEIRALTGEADIPPSLLELTRRAAPRWSASLGLSQ
jgi:hypothetical protein